MSKGDTEVYDYVYYLCTIYYNCLRKTTVIWIDINVVLFNNVRLMKMTKMSTIIIRDINNHKYHHIHKIRNKSTIKHNDNKVHKLYQITIIYTQLNIYTLTKTRRAVCDPATQHQDHQVYRHQAASDLFHLRPHPSYSPFQLRLLAPQAYHSAILSLQMHPIRAGHTNVFKPYRALIVPPTEKSKASQPYTQQGRDLHIYPPFN